MKVVLEKSFPLAARPEAAWSLLQDVEAVAGCMPGARITERVDDSHYKGTVTVKLGPASLSFRGEVEVKSIQVKHWGARLGRDTYRGYTGYVIRREGRALLFGGDTAFTPLFAACRSDGPFEAAIMPIGAYDPWIYNHCTPEQAVAMADAAGARLFIPIHHRTFPLSHEGFDEPIERAKAALASEADRLVVREIGDTARLA